jgi:hypothetical protein
MIIIFNFLLDGDEHKYYTLHLSVFLRVTYSPTSMDSAQHRIKYLSLFYAIRPTNTFSKTVFMSRSIEGGERHTLSSRWMGGLMLGRFFSWWHRHAFNQGMMISMTIRTIKHKSDKFYDTSRWNKTANSLSWVWFNFNTFHFKDFKTGRTATICL